MHTRLVFYSHPVGKWKTTRVQTQVIQWCWVMSMFTFKPYTKNTKQLAKRVLLHLMLLSHKYRQYRKIQSQPVHQIQSGSDVCFPTWHIGILVMRLESRRLTRLLQFSPVMIVLKQFSSRTTQLRLQFSGTLIFKLDWDSTDVKSQRSVFISLNSFNQVLSFLSTKAVQGNDQRQKGNEKNWLL